MMGPVDGHAFLKRLHDRDDRDQFPVVVVSATPGAVPKDLRSSVLETLQKPFQIETLLALLDQHC